MLLKEFIAEATASLRGLYPEAEAHRIVLTLCESVLGVTSYTHLIEPQTEVPPRLEGVLAADLERLRAAEPIQYVTGRALFCDREFRVTSDVLIPRPETECLVREALAAAQVLERLRIPAGRSGEALRILDLCTGSGCIAWTMALSLPGAQVIGVDISEAALAVACSQDFGRSLRRGGSRAPEFVRCDVLAGEIPFPEGSFDLVLANPPYVLESQRAAMRRNVLEYEPPLALFVPDADPLVFYRAVARWSRHCLAPGGRGFVETNEDLGPETCAVFLQNDFENAVTVQDFFGKNRIVAF